MLFTPGHTKESISLVYIDLKRTTDADGSWAIFTGDTLFVGDIGRLDLSGAGTAEEMYKSLKAKLLSFDDYVEIYPAHYVGSVCGSGMSLKTVSTIGFERRFNPAIQALSSLQDFEKFLKENLAPYFPEHKVMKRLNSGREAYEFSTTNEGARAPMQRRN